MASKSLIAALALTTALAGLAAPGLLSAQTAEGTAPTTEQGQTPTPPADADAGMADEMHGGMGHDMGGMDMSAIDTDSDGAISREEFDAFRLSRVAGLDTDADGFISAEELKASILARMQDRATRMTERRMAAQDADGDGKLSAAELLAAPMPGAMFDRVDRDGDGVASAEEIAAMHDRMKDRGRGHGTGHHGKGHGEGRGGWMSGFWGN